MTTHKQWFAALPGTAKALSDDPDTQTACIIVSRGCIPVRGANRLPGDLAKTPERLTRPAKYSWIQHAERNAITRAADEGVPTCNAVMYLNWFPCSDCATDIVAAGIRELHCDQAAYEARKDDPRYGFAQAMEKLTEAGVRIIWH